jgi:hypothetical protein
MPVSIEHHVEWISDAIGHLVRNDIRLIEPTKEAEESWTVHNRQVAEQTLYPTADSWYMNQNIPDKPTVFTPYIGGADLYHDTIREVAEKGYEGFELTESVKNLGQRGEQPRLRVMEGD